jgi:hypothetical protein
MRGPTIWALVAAAAVSACGTKESGLVGTWRLDVEKVLETTLGALEQNLGQAHAFRDGRLPTRETLRKSVDRMHVEYVLKEDRTFEGRLSLDGNAASTVKGRWEDRGSVVALTLTEMKGEPVAPGRSTTVELTKHEGRLESTHGPIALVLTRR